MMILNQYKVSNPRNIISKKINKWMASLNALEKFHYEHGHCCVPMHLDPKLGLWVSLQRTQKKKGSLTKEQEQRLDDLGFSWDPFHTAWMQKYEVLKAFQNKNGHCRVRKRYEADPSLASWVDRQRQDNRKGRLSEERKQMLLDLGFEFNPLHSTWLEQFHLLKEFQQTHGGSCWVPQKYKADPALGEWVHNQRQDRKRGRLSKERKQMLNDLGFEWNKSKSHE